MGVKTFMYDMFEVTINIIGIPCLGMNIVFMKMGLLIRTKTPFQLKVYDVVTKGLFSNPRHQNHRTC